MRCFFNAVNIKMWIFVFKRRFVGGSEPEKLSNAACLAQRFGYDEININVGCPSSRVATKGNQRAFTTWIKFLAQLAPHHRIECNFSVYGVRLPLLGCFGATLMKTPDRVQEIVSAIKRQVQIPVTVKCRIGVDEYDSSEFLNKFIKVIKMKLSCSPILISALSVVLRN